MANHEQLPKGHIIDYLAAVADHVYNDPESRQSILARGLMYVIDRLPAEPLPEPGTPRESLTRIAAKSQEMVDWLISDKSRLEKQVKDLKGKVSDHVHANMKLQRRMRDMQKEQNMLRNMRNLAQAELVALKKGQ